MLRVDDLNENQVLTITVSEVINRQIDFTVAAGPLPGFGRLQGPYAIDATLTHDQIPLHLETELSFGADIWTCLLYTSDAADDSVLV